MTGFRVSTFRRRGLPPARSFDILVAVYLESTADPSKSTVLLVTEVGKAPGERTLSLRADHLELKKASEPQPVGVPREDVM